MARVEAAKEDTVQPWDIHVQTHQKAIERGRRRWAGRSEEERKAWGAKMARARWAARRTPQGEGDMKEQQTVTAAAPAAAEGGSRATKGNGIFLSGSQACAYLGVGRKGLQALINDKALTASAPKEGVGNRIRVPLQEVLALKARIESGAYKVPRKKTGGWRRPDLQGKRRGIAAMHHQIRNVQEAVTALAVKVDRLLEGK